MSLKHLAVVTTVTLAALVAFAFWTRSIWLEEMDAQCESAMPLVRAASMREEVVGRLGAPSAEDGFEDLPELERQFGSADTTETTRDLRQRLQQQG